MFTGCLSVWFFDSGLIYSIRLIRRDKSPYRSNFPFYHAHGSIPGTKMPFGYVRYIGMDRFLMHRPEFETAIYDTLTLLQKYDNDKITERDYYYPRRYCDLNTVQWDFPQLQYDNHFK